MILPTVYSILRFPRISNQIGLPINLDRTRKTRPSGNLAKEVKSEGSRPPGWRPQVRKCLERHAIALYICLLTCSIILNSLTASALDLPLGEATVSVRVESKPQLTSAKGIVFSSRSSFEVPEAAVTKIGDKLYEITFSVPRSKVQADSVASAIATNEEGGTVFAGVTPAITSEARDLLASVPECPGQDSSRTIATTSPGTLKQLVDVRAERMDIVRIKLKRAMDGNVLAKLAKFEEAFGLTRAVELSPDLPPAELFDRLSNIQHALRKYQTHQPKHLR